MNHHNNFDEMNPRQSSTTSSFNSGNTYHGTASNNTTNYTTIYNYNGEPSKEDIPKCITTPENQKDQKKKEKKLIPFDQKIMELVWKYLSKDDKFNCTLVCKSFNKLISHMDCFRLIVDSLGLCYEIFHLKRIYKTVTIDNFCFIKESNDYKGAYKMVVQLSPIVINLRIINCHFYEETLIDILLKLKKLESLELKIRLINPPFKLTSEKCPFEEIRIKDLKIDLCGSSIHYIIDPVFIKVQSVSTLFTNALHPTPKMTNVRSLTLKNCSFGKLFGFGFKGFDWDRFDVKIFDSLLNLRELYLIDNASWALEILKSKCIDGLTDLEVFYKTKYSEKKVVDEFLKNYLWKKEIHDLELSENGFPKKTSITKIKCPFPENIKTTFYHIHHCDFKYSYINNEWKTIPVNPNKYYYEDFGRFSGLSIQVRDDLKDYKIVKDIKYVKSKNVFNKKNIY